MHVQLHLQERLGEMQTGAINEVTFYILERAVIQGLTLLFGYHSLHVLSMDTVVPQWDLPGINLPTTTTTEVRFGWVLIGSTKLSHCMNPGLDIWFSSCLGVNFGLDFGQVRKISGSNFDSGPNCGITILVPSNTAIYQNTR